MIWFLFEFDDRINRARMWLAMLVILCGMLCIGILMVIIEQLFGNPVKSLHFNVNDIFKLVDPAVLRAAIVRLREGKEASPAHLVLVFFHASATLIFSWVYLATSIKRLHDRNKRGWWILPYFVIPGLYGQFGIRLPDFDWMLPFSWGAVLLMIAGFVELFCLKGTRWTNRFGPNPLPKIQTRLRSSHGTSSGWKQGDAIELVPHQASSGPGMHVKRGHD